MEGWGRRVHTNLRSMNGDLIEGITDGADKKIAPNRGGLVEGTTAEARYALSDYFKIGDSPTNYLPVIPFVKMRG